jgi:anti-sigma regulatory factor (Ser/Thr protein kinase)
MIVSELVTNALEATRKERLDSPIRLTFIAGPGSLLIAVWDAADSAPAPREADGEALSGRGLLIVEALSARWDCKPGPADRGGKTVRAVLGASGWDRTSAS